MPPMSLVGEESVHAVVASVRSFSRPGLKSLGYAASTGAAHVFTSAKRAIHGTSLSISAESRSDMRGSLDILVPLP